MLLRVKDQPIAKTWPRLHQRGGLKFLLLSPLLALGLGLGYRQWQIYTTEPQAIFVLGGHESREWQAAKLAKEQPHLPIWISSGSPEHYAYHIFGRMGIEGGRLHLNYQAQDTVTNFTTLVDDLQSQGIRSVYLVTSDNHMARARIVGEIVFGSRGIILKPLPVASQGEPESPEKLVRDGLRALLWLGTGKTGAHWLRRTISQRP